MAHASNIQNEQGSFNPNAVFRRDLSYSATFDSIYVKSLVADDLQSQIAHLRNCTCHNDKESCPVPVKDHAMLGRIILLLQDGICKQTVSSGNESKVLTRQQSIDSYGSANVSRSNRPSLTG